MGWALNQLAKSPAIWRWVIAAVSSSMSTGSPAASASNWAWQDRSMVTKSHVAASTLAPTVRRPWFRRIAALLSPRA